MTSAEIAEPREFISGELQKVHTRFDGVDGRLDQMDGRLDQVDGRLDQVKGGLAEVRKRVDQVRIDQEAFHAHVAHHFGAVYTRLDDVSARLSRAETKREEMRSDFRLKFRFRPRVCCTGVFTQGPLGLRTQSDELRIRMDLTRTVDT